MTQSATAGTIPTPVHYEPTLETRDNDEAQTNEGLIETITQIQSKVYSDSSHATRGVHAKGHGILIGELRVLDNLSPFHAQGLFAQPASYPVVMRFSTIPGDVLDDSISVPRGLAIKVIGVPGARVPGTESDVTQDFVLANGPAFSKSHPKDFLHTLKLLASTTDKAPGLKKALSVVMRATEKALEGVGGQSSTFMTLGGYPAVHPLGDEFYSQTPLLYGAYIAKVAVKPFSTALRQLSKAPLEGNGRPNAIRESIVDFFRTSDGEWDLQVQLCTDVKAMPIEDAAVQWPEDQSPYKSVARISIPTQDAWSSDRVTLVDEGMSFSPWHALAAHRPLGAMNRVRRSVYEHAARFRAEHNHLETVEPRTRADLP
jgi:hypothetical protein